MQSALEKCPYPFCHSTVPGAWATKQQVDEGRIDVFIRNFKKGYSVVLA